MDIKKSEATRVFARQVATTVSLSEMEQVSGSSFGTPGTCAALGFWTVCFEADGTTFSDTTSNPGGPICN